VILDFHTHAFPKDLSYRAVTSLAKCAHLINYHDGSIAALRESMALAGITHAVQLNIAVKLEQTENTNRFAKKVLDKYTLAEPSIIPFAGIHPFDPDWKTWLHRIKREGFRGIKLHPDYQRFFVDDYRLEPFYQEVARLGLVMMFHAGYDAGLPDPIHASPRRLANVLPLLERCKTVLAHMGGMYLYQGVLGLLCGRNVYFDTSVALGLMDIDTAREIFRRHTPDRMLFATDSPWDDQSAALRYFRDSIAEGFLSSEDTGRVLWGNGAGLLGL